MKPVLLLLVKIFAVLCTVKNPANFDLKSIQVKNPEISVLQSGNNAKNIQLIVPSNSKYTAELYETSENKSLSKLENINLNESLSIPRQSICTVVIIP
jgi:hypothetical protein